MSKKLICLSCVLLVAGSIVLSPEAADARRGSTTILECKNNFVL